MNKLNLSKEQEKKLLQMCDDLFTEVKNTTISPTNDEILFWFKFGDVESIHWFEVCVVHLPKKIAENFDTVYPKEKHAFIVDMMMKKMLDYSSFDKMHPVDYLFEMYQKTLKKE